VKITKSQLKQLIKEELESVNARISDEDGPADDSVEVQDEKLRLSQLVDDMLFEHDDFLIKLIEQAGKYLQPRKEELEKQMKDALVNLLLAGVT